MSDSWAAFRLYHLKPKAASYPLALCRNTYVKRQGKVDRLGDQFWLLYLTGKLSNHSNPQFPHL